MSEKVAVIVAVAEKVAGFPSVLRKTINTIKGKGMNESI